MIHLDIQTTEVDGETVHVIQASTDGSKFKNLAYSFPSGPTREFENGVAKARALAMQMAMREALIYAGHYPVRMTAYGSHRNSFD